MLIYYVEILRCVHSRQRWPDVYLYIEKTGYSIQVSPSVTTNSSSKTHFCTERLCVRALHVCVYVCVSVP